MKVFLILFFVGGALSANKTLDGVFAVLNQSETATDYPPGAMDGDPTFVTDEDSTLNISMLIGKQNEITDETTTTLKPESSQNCTKAHEHYEVCGPRCQTSCNVQVKVSGRNSRSICQARNKGNGKCFEGCFCDSGYVRFNDECILPTECPTRTCGPNEEFTRHGTVCELTCDNFKYAKEIEEQCPKDLPVAGCFCKPGYVRGCFVPRCSNRGGCILPNTCRASSTA